MARGAGTKTRLTLAPALRAVIEGAAVEKMTPRARRAMGRGWLIGNGIARKVDQEIEAEERRKKRDTA